jgi:hypothetical protein
MGWFSNDDPQLGSKSVSWWRKQPTATVDPREVRMASTPVNRDAVDYYRRNPNGKFRGWDHDGDPCVVIGRNGVAELRNGKHRALAAIAEGRRLKVRVVDERSGR